MQDKDRCSECGAFNPRTNLLCNGCGARLPWADALEQERLQQRAARGQAPATGVTDQSVPWSDPNRATTGGVANVSRYASIQRSLWRVETVLLVLILLVGWTPVAIIHMAKAKAGTSHVCEVCGKAGLPLVYGRVSTNTERDKELGYATEDDEERSASNRETLDYCVQHYLTAPREVSVGGKYDFHDKGRQAFLITLVATASFVVRLTQRKGLYEVAANTKWWELIRKELIVASLGLVFLSLIIYSQYGDWIQTLLR